MVGCGHHNTRQSDWQMNGRLDGQSGKNPKQNSQMGSRRKRPKQIFESTRPPRGISKALKDQWQQQQQKKSATQKCEKKTITKWKELFAKRRRNHQNKNISSSPDISESIYVYLRKGVNFSHPKDSSTIICENRAHYSLLAVASLSVKCCIWKLFVDLAVGSFAANQWIKATDNTRCINANNASQESCSKLNR